MIYIDNQRIIYQVKESLVYYEMNSLIDMDDTYQKWAIAYSPFLICD